MLLFLLIVEHILNFISREVLEETLLNFINKEVTRVVIMAFVIIIDFITDGSTYLAYIIMDYNIIIILVVIMD